MPGQEFELIADRPLEAATDVDVEVTESTTLLPSTSGRVRA